MIEPSFETPASAAVLANGERKSDHHGAFSISR
jgi:hypothetical protein